MLLTFAVLIVGQGFNEFVEKIVTGQSLGGGPVESIYRMVTHMNQTVALELSKPVENTIKGTDKVVENGLWLVQQTFSELDLLQYVALRGQGLRRRFPRGDPAQHCGDGRVSDSVRASGILCLEASGA